MCEFSIYLISVKDSLIEGFLFLQLPHFTEKRFIFSSHRTGMARAFTFHTEKQGVPNNIIY